jgi:methyl-accepting chemotaxis protein
LLGSLLALIVIAGCRAVWHLLGPLDGLASAARRWANAEPSRQGAPEAGSELELMARTLDSVRHHATQRQMRLQASTSALTDRLGDALRQVERTAAASRAEIEALREAHGSMAELGAAQPEVVATAESLRKAIENSCGAMVGMTGSIEEVAETAESLDLAVDEAASTIEQIATSIQHVAGSTGRLSGSMDEAVSVISRIETSVEQVEQDTREASRLSQQVSQEAARGSVAVQKTIEGMRRIRRAVQQTARGVRILGGRSKEIGEILHVIDEVAGQTNLLAINAAIIAAQAGEHGKGFATVAEEIRDLAERTAASTKEIDNLVRTVQREAAQAVDAMEEGLSSVEEGVELSNNAGEALERILERAENSSTTARAIAEEIREQAYGSKRVTQEIENIRSMVKQINLATQAQAQASTLLTRATREMKELTERVAATSLRQGHGGQALLGEAGQLRREAARLSAALDGQAAAIHRAAGRIAGLCESADLRLEPLTGLHGTLEGLEARCRTLGEATSRSDATLAPGGHA